MKRCDAVLELVLLLDMEVPQGLGRFDAEASNGAAEKNQRGPNGARTTN